MDEEIDINMDDALAQMGQDFGDTTEPGGGADTEPQAPPPASASSAAAPATPPAATAPAPEPWRTPPKAWKQEMHPFYGKLTPEVMQYLHQREEEFINGVAQYKHPLEEYNKVFDHYKPWFEAHNLKPLDAFTRLANSHIALLGQGVTPEIREKYLQALITDYGLEETLRKLYGAPAAPPDPAQAGVEQLLQQRVNPVLERVTRMEQSLQARQQAEEQERMQAIQADVDKFLTSPENEFARELIQDMTQLIQAGVASDLKTAYEKACRLNPSVSAKMMQREIEKATQPQKPPPRNVRSTGTQAASTKPAADEDMDATLRRTLAEIQSRA